MKNSNVYLEAIDLIESDNIFKSTICCCFFSSMEDYKDTIKYLHANEHSYLDKLKFQKRIKSYLIGRFAAKKSVAALIGEESLENILIEFGIFSQPVVISQKQNIQVSITHCDDFGIAIAFSEACPMGIDIERVRVENIEIMENQITSSEKILIEKFSFSFEKGYTLLWTVKESLSKIFKTGLTASFTVFEICKIEDHTNYLICYYKNFAQYKALVTSIGDYIIAITYPKNMKMDFDICSFHKNFSFIRSMEVIETK